MSEAGSPAALDQAQALRAALHQFVEVVLRGELDPAVEEARIIDSFLADWLVMKASDYQFDLARQHEWQSEAKLGFAVFFTAIGTVADQYPALKLGPRILGEAERLIVEKGLDPDEVLNRFLP